MASSSSDLFKVRNRVWQYWNGDGLPTMTTSTAGVLVGVGFLWSHHTRSFLPILLLLVSIMFLLDGVTSRKVPEWLKLRITYPRTGYAKLPDFKTLVAGGTSYKRLVTLTWICAVVFTMLMIALWSVNIAWYLIVFQIIEGGLCCFFIYKVRVAWWTCLPQLIGIFLIAMISNERDKLPVLIIQMNAHLFLMGADRLLKYLKEHPLPQA